MIRKLLIGAVLGVTTLSSPGCTFLTGGPTPILSKAEIELLVWAASYSAAKATTDLVVQRDNIDVDRLRAVFGVAQDLAEEAKKVENPTTIHATLYPVAQRFIWANIDEPELQRLYLAVFSSVFRQTELVLLSNKDRHDIHEDWFWITAAMFDAAFQGVIDHVESN